MKTLETLKSEAYDCLVQVEAWQAKLAEANKAIKDWKEDIKPSEVTGTE